jgi:hypothetical protein
LRCLDRRCIRNLQKGTAEENAKNGNLELRAHGIGALIGERILKMPALASIFISTGSAYAVWDVKAVSNTKRNTGLITSD